MTTTSAPQPLTTPSLPASRLVPTTSSGTPVRVVLVVADVPVLTPTLVPTVPAGSRPALHATPDRAARRTHRRTRVAA